MSWTVEQWIPYEGSSLLNFDTAKEVKEFLEDLSPRDRCDCVVFPTPIKRYEAGEFIEAVNNEEVK